MDRLSFIAFLILVSLAGAGCSKVDFAKIDADGPAAGGKSGIEDPCLTGQGDCGGTDPSSAPNVVQQQVVVKAPASEVDVIVVADTSGSMAEERAEFGTRLDNFIAQIQDLDWRLCVITTDVIAGKGELRPFGTSGLYALNKNVPSYQTLFLNTMTSLPAGSGDEQGIRASYMAVQLKDPRCIRPNASLAMVVLSDEDERSTGGYEECKDNTQYRPLALPNLPATLVDEVPRALGADKIFSFHSLVIRSDDLACFDEQRATHQAFPGTRYEEASRMTGGVIGNICSRDYGAELGRFASGVRRDLQAVSLKCEPLANTLQLKVTSVPQSFQFTYVLTGNKVHFTPALPEGAVVDLTYTCPQ